MLRVGMIGCGEIAVANARSIHNAQNACIAMAMDVVENVAKDIGEKYNAPYTTDVKELLANPDVDAVIISTPHYLHAPLAIQSAEAGKHVMVEKPIAINLKQADEMIAACEKAGVLLSVCFVSRYSASTVKSQELIEQGVIGKIIGIKISGMSNKPEHYWHGGYSGRVKTDWRQQLDKSGGGYLIMNLVHNIDRLRYITGLEAVRVYSEYDTFVTPVEVEDMLNVVIRYNNGAIGSIDGSSGAVGGESFGDRIYGTEGQIVSSNPLRVCTTKSVEGLNANEWNSIKLEEAYDSRVRFIEEFAEAVFAGKQPPITGHDGRATLEIIVAAYESGKRKSVVELPM
ncbi:Gfo/Idh/MocA family oxidoreductase [Candidatus Poribacteria bacterium]|nr:Gfo/Idh/MocA family oxidoreductase [Candidatus Poribacteria bacterium]